MKIFGLLADTILTCISETSLDAPLAWSLISCKGVSLSPCPLSSILISNTTLLPQKWTTQSTQAVCSENAVN